MSLEASFHLIQFASQFLRKFQRSYTKRALRANPAETGVTDADEFFHVGLSVTPGMGLS
jgi:hypothetical protein